MYWNQPKRGKIETRVLNWLAEKGFQLISQDWRYCHGQVDIIASHSDQLHFIGIATKSYPDTGIQQGITRRKMLSFVQASQQYLKRHPHWKEVIIDFIEVTLISEEPTDFVLVKNIRLT